MNKAILIGNLGKDPDVKMAGESKLCKFSLATNNRDSVDWHNVVCWNKTAELCEQYLRKGSKIGIEGRISYRSWENENGVKQYMTEIVADRVEFLDSRSQEHNTSSESVPVEENFPF